jgi:sugar diacid utilization regulator
MVVEMWDMYGLVDHNVIYLAGQGVIIGKRTTNGGIGLSAEGGVIPFDNNRSVVIK